MDKRALRVLMLDDSDKAIAWLDDEPIMMNDFDQLVYVAKKLGIDLKSVDMKTGYDLFDYDDTEEAMDELYDMLEDRPRGTPPPKYSEIPAILRERIEADE